VTTPPALVDRPSTPDAATADEFSLSALLDLFGPADPSVDPTYPSLRTAGVRLCSWTRQTSRRAAAWGALAGVGHESTGVR
jgi:hypothetical protein